MPTVNETGHAKNLANFQDLIAFCASYPTYNPSSAALTVAGLNTKYTDARTALNGVIAAQTTFNNAVNVRMAAFEGLCLSPQELSVHSKPAVPMQKK